MPSRLGAALIVLFWLGTTAFVVQRDVLPRLQAGNPPPLRIDLVDEASSRVPARWVVYRGDQKVGSLTTEMRYQERDDTFWFDSVYREIRFPFGDLVLYGPEIETGVRVTREGDLREQMLAGKLELLSAAEAAVRFNPATNRDGVRRLFPAPSAEVEVRGLVTDGVLNGHVHLSSPFGGFDRALDPVPVPSGRVLNPMMPVGRLWDVRPGQRWVIRQTDPLGEALGAAFKQMAKGSPVGGLVGGATARPVLLAEVRSRAEVLERKGERVDCWVIDYTVEGDADKEAVTWVAAETGRVLRQQAGWLGETLRFERDD